MSNVTLRNYMDRVAEIYKAAALEVAKDADKLMYAKNAAAPTTYWIRTPDAGGAFSVRICYVGSGGALYYNFAISSYGAAPLAILA